MTTSKKPRFPLGKTCRVTLRTVREDPCEFSASEPSQMLRYWRSVIAAQPDFESDKESIVVVMLTTRHRPFAWHRVSLGSCTGASARMADILRPVIVSGAYGFVMMHNHPSGDPSPSRDDFATTKAVNDGASLMNLVFLDHVVIGDDHPRRLAYFSFREANVIQ